MNQKKHSKITQKEKMNHGRKEPGQKQSQHFSGTVTYRRKKPSHHRKISPRHKTIPEFSNGDRITKELTVRYKQHLQEQNYAIRSINSMLTSINHFLDFLGRTDCKVKTLRSQRQIYCPEEKELTKAEYLRLLEASRQYPQLNHIIPKFGNPVDRSNIWAQMKHLCKAANINPSKVFPHNLRKLFARTFYKIEKDIAKLADILGHTSVETTRIYIMSTGHEHRQKIERLGLVI